MEDPVKRKVVKVSGYNVAPSSRPPTRPISRPGSPLKGHTSPPSSLPSSGMRPKAKVNSSAMIARKASGSSSVASTSRITVGNSMSRPTSPFKSTTVRSNLGLTPASAVKARVTAHTPSKSTDNVSTPSSPESRQRALTAIASDASRSNHDRRRRGSFSLHHTYSSSSLNTSNIFVVSPVTSSPNRSPVVDNPQTGPGAFKIKSKISGLAKSPADNVSSLSPSPSTRPTHSRTRAPSISSSVITKSISASPSAPDQQFYPITTAVRAASPYRFATSKYSPPTNHHHYRPFLPNDEQPGNYNKPSLGAKVDPAAIPLPPLSPPTSALSFSSHSSLSYTSTSTDSHRSISTIGSRVNPQARGHKRELSIQSTSDDPANGVIPKMDVSVLSDSVDGDGEETDGESGGSERKVKAEAKSNRKIADLEITNRSLLAINSSLETTKHRQAKEIRDLRRKLRESRLILPPRAYQAVKSSLDHDDTASEDDDDDDDADEERSIGTQDEVYKRVKTIIEGLIETGQRALESKPEDFLEGVKGGAKVLHAEEVRMWRYSADESRKDSHLGLGDSISSSRSISPSHIMMPDDISSEGEVEAITSFALDPESPGLPPITVTLS